MSTAKRFSKQRYTVLNELSKLDTHPTAEEIYEITRKQIPNISLGTIYRNLKNMEQDGQILKFTINGKDHFDAEINPHMHLCCEKCGKITDLHFDCNQLKADFLNNADFTINNIIINGICKQCLK